MDVQRYFVFLTELRQALDALTALEQRKITAVQNGNLEELEQCMKQEQAAALDLRGREQKREAMLRELNLEQVSLREFPDHCPLQDRRRASELTGQVLRSYQVLSSAQTAARTLMESNLRRIQHTLEQHETIQQPQQSAVHKPQTDFRA